jgi:hypothetical protein
VEDKSPVAKARLENDYNIAFYPTVFFDGGYRVDPHAGSTPSAKAAYDASLTACGTRTVPDIDLKVEAIWLDGGDLSVCLDVDNNESTAYQGTVRAYIVEIESSMGWFDSSGTPYAFPVLGIIEQSFTALANDSWGTCVPWDGSSFPTITYDNIMVVGAVFNSTWNQGYADPPSGNPFDAYYVDETGADVPDALTTDSPFLSSTLGGAATLGLYAGSANAGRKYYMLGSVTGTSGIPLPGGQATLPLTWDFMTNVVLNLMNSFFFTNFAGTLAGDGTATATFNLPAGAAPVGLKFYFAYALKGPWDFASNPIEIEIL